MKKKDVKDASTKHKGLPEKKVSKESFEIDPRNIDRHKEQKRLEPSLNRDRQRGKKRAKSRLGSSLYGSFSTVEDMHGNVMAMLILLHMNY